MANRVTRDAFERRFEARRESEQVYSSYMDKINHDRMDRVHQETDQRSIQRRNAARQRIADEEFQMAEKIYRRNQEQELRRIQMEEQDAIARELHEQKNAEIRDQAQRGLLRERDPEYRELQAKLNLALVSQTRDMQREEIKRRRQDEERQRLEQESQMLEKMRMEEEFREAEEEAKRIEALDTRKYIQQQMEDQKRRRRLIEEAQAEKDKRDIDAIVNRIGDEDRRRNEQLRQKQQHSYQEMQEFMRARQAVKEAERLREEEERRKIYEFSQGIDERLRRAQEEQKRRDEQRRALGEKIALDIRRKKIEQDEYENLCLELAEQQELQKLQDRERAEAEKIRRQIEEAKMFMEQTHRAKALERERTRQEEIRLKQEIADQQKRLAEIAEIEQEQNRIRIEKYRREIARQLTQKKEMFEAARQEELRKLALEQQREEERQRILDEERRKLVISHILEMGPNAVKYLPKGVLKNDDLDYLPEEYRNAILRSHTLENH